MEIRMTRFGLIGAAALVLSSTLAAPVMAQQVAVNSGYHNSYNRWDGDRRRDARFWPGEVAAGVAGAAVGTAAAIATAPFRGDSYAYDNPGWHGQSYAERN